MKSFKAEMPESYVAKSHNPTINFLDHMVFEHNQLNKDIPAERVPAFMAERKSTHGTSFSQYTSKVAKRKSHSRLKSQQSGLKSFRISKVKVMQKTLATEVDELVTPDQSKQ